LALRVVTLAVAGSALVVAAVSGFLLYRVSENITERAQEASRATASQALAQIEQSLTGVDQAMAAGKLYDVAQQAIQRGTVGGYYVSFTTDAGSFSTAGLAVDASFSAELRDAVATSATLVHFQPTRIWFDDQDVPGYAVGTTVTVGPNSFRVFFAFPLERENQTLRDVRTALIVASGFLVVGVGLVAFGVTRMTLRPIRVARRAAERLAAGELTERMPVRGTDDLARLAVSMNHMANQLQSRIHDLEQLSRVQQRFVSDVSHELRTPLTTVRMAADVLYDGRDAFEPIAARSAVLLRREVDRFEALLADLLEISRFDAGAAVLSLDEADLVPLIRAEIRALAQVAKASGSQVHFHPAEQAVVAEVDVRRIARLVRNLLSNAIAHGEGRPIDVTLAADDEITAFAVRDHGVGFTAEESKQLFNRFWRADPARARHIGGTGLGLAISQEDVRLHQGWLHAWGRPGQGAQFRVTLPRRPDVVVTRSPLPLVPPDAPREALAAPGPEEET
jgi:two-component system sensor histidine kinase MtrB